MTPPPPLKARQGGWLSPNDAREETGWPRVDGGDSIEPPVAGGKPAGDAPPTDGGDKIARLDEHRAAHVSD